MTRKLGDRPKLKKGTRVHHWRYGDGEVKDLYLDGGIAVVRFDEADTPGSQVRDIAVNFLQPIRKRGLFWKKFAQR